MNKNKSTNKRDAIIKGKKNVIKRKKSIGVEWHKHEEFIETQVLNSPDSYVWIDKQAQLGLTTSSGKVCLRKRKKMTHFAPTNVIIEDTLGNKIMNGEDYGRIGNNKSMCPIANKDKFFDIHYSACCSRTLAALSECPDFKPKPKPKKSDSREDSSNVDESKETDKVIVSKSDMDIASFENLLTKNELKFSRKNGDSSTGLVYTLPNSNVTIKIYSKSPAHGNDEMQIMGWDEDADEPIRGQMFFVSKKDREWEHLVLSKINIIIKKAEEKRVKEEEKKKAALEDSSNDSKECAHYKRGGDCKLKGGKCDKVEIEECDIKPGKCRDGLCEYKWDIENDFNMHGLTYDKFRSLIRRKYDENDIEFEHSMDFKKQKLLEKIFASDVLLLDEFPRLIVYKPQGFFVKDLEHAFEIVKKKFELIAEISKLYGMDKKEDKKKMEPSQYLCKCLKAFVDGIKDTELVMETTVHRPDGTDVFYQYGIYQNPNPLELPNAGTFGYTTMKSLNELKEHVKTIFGLEESDGKKVLDIMQSVYMAMTYDEVWMYVKHDKTSDTDKLYAFPNIKHPLDDLKPYLEEFTKKGGKVIATGMKFPVMEKSIDWKRVTMPDFNKTEEKHLVVCDTKEMSFKKAEFDKDGKCIIPDHWTLYEDDIKDMILNLKKRFDNIPVIVFAFNKEVYRKLSDWVEEIKTIEPSAKDILVADSLCFTYFRSSLGSGVRLDFPVKFYIGAADTPDDAYDECELLWGIPSDFLRLMEMADTFKNAVGRGKDPEGIKPSISFIIGAREGKVKALLPDKKEIVQVYTQKSIYYLSRYYTHCWFKLRKHIKNIDDLPIILEIANIVWYRWNNGKGKFITKYDDIYRNWRQKIGFDMGVKDIRRFVIDNIDLLPDWIQVEREYMKVISNEARYFSGVDIDKADKNKYL